MPNKVGTILGEEQWKWLGEELSDNSVDLYIVGSGIQFIAEDHAYEKWANFPNERKRLFDLFSEKEPNGLLLLSGDRHIAEISEQYWDGIDYPLVDVTSSGLTHTWTGAAKEENQHRVGKLIAQLNYGVLELSLKRKGALSLMAEVKGDKQAQYLKYKIEYILK
jgi:alkaline phosphatase D